MILCLYWEFCLPFEPIQDVGSLGSALYQKSGRSLFPEAHLPVAVITLFFCITKMITKVLDCKCRESLREHFLLPSALLLGRSCSIFGNCQIFVTLITQRSSGISLVDIQTGFCMAYVRKNPSDAQGHAHVVIEPPIFLNPWLLAFSSARSDSYRHGHLLTCLFFPYMEPSHVHRCSDNHFCSLKCFLMNGDSWFGSPRLRSKHLDAKRRHIWARFRFLPPPDSLPVPR